VSVLLGSSDRAYIDDLEHDVRATVEESLEQRDLKMEGTQANPRAAACACVTTIPGDRIPHAIGPPFPWWSNGVWVNPAPDRVTWLIGVYLDEALRNWALLRLSPGATMGIGPNQMLLGLANRTDWAKEVWGFNICTGLLGSVFQGGRNPIARTMVLEKGFCREGADTIVFRKPGFLGIWYFVGHFDPSSFWEAFGGTVAMFEWFDD
jgi:hypothetical protein